MMGCSVIGSARPSFTAVASATVSAASRFERRRIMNQPMPRPIASRVARIRPSNNMTADRTGAMETSASITFEDD